MRVALGNRHAKRGAPIDLAFHADVSAVQLDQLTHERQPDARSLRPSLRLDRPVEPLEDAGKLLFGDADARIGDLEQSTIGLFTAPAPRCVRNP